MKRKFLLGLSVFFVSFLITTGLFAQSNSIEQRLVGTWVLTRAVSGGSLAYLADQFEISITFNSNGTFIDFFYVDNVKESSSGRWAISGSRLVLITDYQSKHYRGDLYFCDIYIIPDGKTMLWYYDTKEMDFSEYTKK
jgi:hypothetical protein